MGHDLVKIYTIRTEEGFRNIASFINKEDAFKKGLLPESIIGYFTNQINTYELIPEYFLRNSLFVDFLHKSIAEYAPQTKSFQVTARKLKNGWVYIIDQRTPDPNGTVPPEDIIGAFEIKKGKFINGSYKPNKNHRILSHHGFFKLDFELYEYLLSKLHKMYESSN